MGAVELEEGSGAAAVLLLAAGALPEGVGCALLLPLPVLEGSGAVAEALPEGCGAVAVLLLPLTVLEGSGAVAEALPEGCGAVAVLLLPLNVLEGSGAVAVLLLPL